MPWSPVASLAALAAAGVADAAAMIVVLPAYLTTLSRVLVLVADVRAD